MLHLPANLSIQSNNKKLSHVQAQFETFEAFHQIHLIVSLTAFIQPSKPPLRFTPHAVQVSFQVDGARAILDHEICRRKAINIHVAMAVLWVVPGPDRQHDPLQLTPVHFGRLHLFNTRQVVHYHTHISTYDCSE